MTLFVVGFGRWTPPLWEGGLVVVRFGTKPLGIVAFGKADRGNAFPGKVVLLHQPGAAVIPPFRAVEYVVETGLGGSAGPVGGTAQGFRRKLGPG